MLTLQEGHTRQRAALQGHGEVKGDQCPVSVYSQFLGQCPGSALGSVSRSMSRSVGLESSMRRPLGDRAGPRLGQDRAG